MIWNGRVPEWFGLEGALKPSWFHPTGRDTWLQALSNLALNVSEKCIISTSLETQRVSVTFLRGFRCFLPALRREQGFGAGKVRDSHEQGISQSGDLHVTTHRGPCRPAQVRGSGGFKSLSVPVTLPGS